MMTVSIPSVTAMVAMAASAVAGAHASAVEVGVLRGEDSRAVDVQPEYGLAIEELNAITCAPYGKRLPIPIPIPCSCMWRRVLACVSPTHSHAW